MFAHTHECVVAFRIDRTRERFAAYCSVLFPGVKVPPLFDCVLDTGATRIVVPQQYWRNHVPAPELLPAREIRGVSGPLQAYEASYEVALTGVIDNTVRRRPPYLLGMCVVCLARDEEAVAAAVQGGLTPQEAGDRYRLRRGLLGLGGGAFDRGGVCINWQGRNAHFVEVC